MVTATMSLFDTRARGRLILVALAVLAISVVIYHAGSYLSGSNVPHRVVSALPSLDYCRSSRKTRPIPSFKTRFEIGQILESEGFTRGVELGVQKGIFADISLRSWKSARQYVLVDLWGHQTNYKDPANVVDTVHESFKQEALKRTSKYATRGTDVQICQGLTLQCVLKYEDAHFDYIYVDARHDYKGVLDDIRAWWPKLRDGGIMAGHDYVTNDDGPKQSGQDWSVNYDGTRDPTGRAAKGAVDDFAEEHGLQVVVSYRESQWNTWAVRKPERA